MCLHCPSSIYRRACYMRATEIAKFLSPFDGEVGRGKWAAYVTQNLPNWVEKRLQKRKNPFRGNAESVQFVPGLESVP